MSPIKLTESEKAYLAGFFDGEGCISISKMAPKSGGINPAHRLVVVFSQSELSCLELWRNRLDIGKVFDITPPAGENHLGIKVTRSHYAWQMYSREAETLLRTLQPYLIIKKDQAQVALDFRATQQDGIGGNGHMIPNTILDLREQYRLKLMAMKKPDEEFILEPRLNRLAELLASQLEFDLDMEAA